VVIRVSKGLAALAILAVSAPARADLADDAERVAREWTQRGARVERLAPIFLEHGRVRALRFPLPALSDPACLTVAFVAVRTAEISVASADRPARGGEPGILPVPLARREGDRRQPSAGGAIALTRCGALRVELARLAIEVATARAAVEILVARSEMPPAELREILPERAAGPSAPRGDTGGPLEPGPIGERLARAALRGRGEGAIEVERSSVRAQASGAGQAVLRAAEGCHRVEVMAETPSTFPHRGTDVDAEVREPGGRLLARDRADVPDARLDFCVGETQPVSITFVGAAGALPVHLAHARWPLPAHVPASFGARARAGFAGALFRRHAPAPAGPPIFSSIGVQGPTSIPIEIQPGRCYLAAAALTRGEARTLRLSVTVGDRVARDDVQQERAEGAALAFCSESETTARLDVDVRGSAPWWALALWPMGSVSP
jgi:hypothetical protein